MIFSTSKTYQPNWVLTGPSSSPFLAAKTASSSAFSCWPLATAGSLPPCALEASSIEYCFDDGLQALAALERLRFASSALASVLVRTSSRSRRSGWAKRFLFLS